MSGRQGRRVPWLTLYAVAMGFLEAVVVVYLRELYYPAGFRFPIKIIPDHVAVAELVRELTTILMIWAVAVLAGRRRTDQFFVFAYLFGVWDIVYYVALWLFLDWPASPMTWDVLFLIPVPWLGPVIYPVVISLFLIAGFVVHDRLEKLGRPLCLTLLEWCVASAGALLVVVAFCWNWRAVAASVTPESFPVALFTVGLLTGLAPFLNAGLRTRR
jgi:hypothetical protein